MKVAPRQTVLIAGLLFVISFTAPAIAQDNSRLRPRRLKAASVSPISHRTVSFRRTKSFFHRLNAWNRLRPSRWCRRPDDDRGDFCESDITPPPGFYLHQHVYAQVERGQAARMILYQYDFFDGSEKLKPRGKAQLKKIAKLMSENAFSLAIEYTPGNPALDQKRRETVFNELINSSYSVPIERIVVGRPRFIGLRGPESEIISQNLLNQTAVGGTAQSAGPGESGSGESSE